MRVLILTALYPPARGGAATYFEHIVPHLLKYNEIESIALLTERMPEQPCVLVDGKLQILRWLPNRISSGQQPFILHTTTYLLTQMWFALKLRALVCHYAIDLIHFHTRYRGPIFYSALRRTQLPIIADLRDKMTDPLQLHGTASRLICCGEGVYNFAVKSGFPADHIALIPNVFTPPECPSKAAVATVQKSHGLANTKYLLYVGDMTFNKGVYELLSAYRSWRIVNPEVLLVLVGVNREGKKFLKQLEQTQGTLYLGHLSHHDVLPLMRGANIVVLPSRSEGLPTVILEAVAMGTKVICPPGIPEFERHLPEFVLPEVSETAIFKTLNKVWDYPQRPIYPFAEHRIDRVGEAHIKLYTSMKC